MLLFDGLHKRFGEVVALAGCGFSVEPGQMLGFLGPNGAGKTTAIRTVFGLVRPDVGAVSWHGHPIGQPERRSFGYMPEERGLYRKMQVRDQLVYFAQLHGLDHINAKESTDRWLDRFGLTDRAKSKLEELSHGNQQRVQLIAALVHDPVLLVLDEPFAGLDPLGAASMAEVLEERAAAGVAVLFSSHQLDVVEDLCEEVVIINKGAIVLSGQIDRLRAASPLRYVEVAAADVSWALQVAGTTVVEQRPGRVRLAIKGDVDLAAVAALAAENGLVSQFILEPPPLSEVFAEAVGA
jgi:ABC-2 type transport system ATP-binding protein